MKVQFSKHLQCGGGSGTTAPPVVWTDKGDCKNRPFQTGLSRLGGLSRCIAEKRWGFCFSFLLRESNRNQEGWSLFPLRCRRASFRLNYNQTLTSLLRTAIKIPRFRVPSGYLIIIAGPCECVCESSWDWPSAGRYQFQRRWWPLCTPFSPQVNMFNLMSNCCSWVSKIQEPFRCEDLFFLLLAHTQMIYTKTDDNMEQN